MSWDCPCEGWSVTLAGWLGMKAFYIVMASALLAGAWRGMAVTSVVDFLAACAALLA